MNIRTIARRLLTVSTLCIIAGIFMFTDPGQEILKEGRSLFSPAIAESASIPTNDNSSFVRALETEIYLPQEVDTTAGSNLVISDNSPTTNTESQELTAMLSGKGRQCSIHNHGSLALNGQSDCI